ncbi:MAG: SDR family NAD(P)-dependent oxidoreductase [Proteobacteria bacterium]|nr:SDR family NAD(P)-dependent oxidoreductase [Pseudomonadota bacterium]
MTTLDKRVALVTGASRGIGFATSVALAQSGVHVVALARTVSGLETLDDAVKSAGGTATLLPYDLLKGDLIEGLGPLLFDKFGRLDVLVGNAAMLGGLHPVAQTDPALWERVFALNVTANMRLIRTCDPLLRASDAGRAVFVTSGAAQSCKPFWGAYAASKAALEALVKVYAAEVAHTSLKVNLLDPGRVRTAMRAHAYPGEDPMTLPAPDVVAKAVVSATLPTVHAHGTCIKAA